MNWYYIRAYKRRLTYYGYIYATDENEVEDIFNKYCPEPECRRCEIRGMVHDYDILRIITYFGNPKSCNPPPILKNNWKPWKISKPVNVIFSVDFDKYDSIGTEGDAFVNAKRIIIPSTEEYRRIKLN